METLYFAGSKEVTHFAGAKEVTHFALLHMTTAMYSWKRDHFAPLAQRDQLTPLAPNSVSLGICQTLESFDVILA